MNTEHKLEHLVREIVHARLKHFSGNTKRTAKSLGIGRATLYRWLEKWRININDMRKDLQ